MKRYFIRILLCILFIFVVSPNLIFAGVIHFENADVVYPEKYYDVAVKVGNIFESVREDVIKLIGYDPGRITIVLQDKGTISNGFTQVLLHKTITLYVWPPEGYLHFTLPLENWYTYLIIHEFTHMCHLSYQDEFAKFLSLITGIPYLPQLTSPFIEGTTVFAESYFSQSSGRLNNPFFSSGLYYYSLPKFPSFSYKETVPQDDYRSGLLYYNFTAGFYQYLVKTYGIDKMKKFLEKTSETTPEFLKFQDSKIEGSQQISDPFVYAFGKPFNELYTDWIMVLTKLDYNQGELIYKLQNSYAIRVDMANIQNNQLAVLRQSFGPVTSYIGSFESSVVFIDKEKNKEIYSVKNDIPVNALDVRYDHNKVYALVPTYSFGKYSNEIWEITSNSLIDSGNISSFGVKDNEIFVCYYDPVNEKSIIKRVVSSKNLKNPNEDFNYTYDGFIRTMEVSDKYIAFITLDNTVVVLDKNGVEIAKLEDRNMKGPFVKILGEKVLFSRIEGEYVIPYYFDLTSKKFFKLGDKTLMSDFIIKDDTMYYISYIPYGVNGGMGIYKQKITVREFDKLPNETNQSLISINTNNFIKGDELSFRLKTFMTPVTWAPMISTEVNEDESALHSLFVIFTFTNVENDTFLVLTPIVDIFQPTPDSFNFQIQGYRQFLGFVTLKDNYSVSGSYVYPTNEYSFDAQLGLGNFYVSPNTSFYTYLGASLKSSKDYSLDSIFSLIGVQNAPSIKSKTLSFGLYTFTNFLGKRIRITNWLILSDDNFDTLFKKENFYIQSSLAIPINLDTSLFSIITLNVSEPTSTQYDISVATTLFKDSAELFNGLMLFKNSGLTFGLANPSGIHGLYTQFFVETYFINQKFYPNVGIFLPLMDLYGLPQPNFNGIFYIGIGNSPHMINMYLGNAF